MSKYCTIYEKTFLVFVIFFSTNGTFSLYLIILNNLSAYPNYIYEKTSKKSMEKCENFAINNTSLDSFSAILDWDLENRNFLSWITCFWGCSEMVWFLFDKICWSDGIWDLWKKIDDFSWKRSLCSSFSIMNVAFVS